MNNRERLGKLLDSLGMEILTAQAGSTQAQFPILDLFGNLRDEAAGKSDLKELHSLCAEAWEKTVVTIESGKPFSQEDVDWLNSLLGRLQKLASAPATPATSVAAEASAPAPKAKAAAAAAPPAPAESGEELVINLNVESDADLLREFLTESREHLDNIEQGVLVLENSPRDAEMLNTVFRAFHTFKGGAGFLNLIPINRLAHVLESLLDLARQDKLAINQPVIELILKGRDVLKHFVDEIDTQVSGGKPLAPILIPTESLKAEVRKMIDGGSNAPVSSPAVEAAETTPAKAAVEEVAAPVAEQPENPSVEARPGAPEAATARQTGTAMVKVDTGKLDSLLDLVGEMVIAQSLVGQNISQLAGVTQQFSRNMAQLGRITRELQRVGMSLRMVPIRGAFQKMARVTRDLGAKQHKKIQLLTSGEDTELDRSVVEELNDPLLHMIRNSVDHGIESPDKRAAAGKPAVGTLHLRAYHQGGNIVVEIEDDGSGLNRDRILAKAVEKGLIAAGGTHTDEEIFNLIFAPGFSTAEKITDISGRGVGLDVVRRNIERLRGRIDISSTPGKGTLFKITLPLTLAIIDGLIVKVGEERYIIPTLSVRESFRPTADMITRVQNRAEVVNVRGRLIPLLRLYEFFNLKPASTDPTESIIIVAQSGANFRCLLVDTLLHKQEVVIKNLNEIMVHKNRALAGAAILGDGRVGMILDVNTLVHLENHQSSFSQAA